MSSEELSQTLSKISDHKYETNIYAIDKHDETYKSPQYKIRIYLNDFHYDICIAIGNKQKNDFVSFKYVYNVKYNEIISKLGVYEFKHNDNDNIYKEGSLCIMNFYLNSFNLDSLKQTKEEYLLLKPEKVISNLSIIIKQLQKHKYVVSEKPKSIKHIINYYNTIIDDPISMMDILAEILELYKSNKINDILRIVDNIIKSNESINKNELLSMIFINKKETILNLIDQFDTLEIKENINFSNEKSELVKPNIVEENVEEENVEEENAAENAAENDEENDEENDQQENEQQENAEENGQQENAEENDQQENAEENDQEENAEENSQEENSQEENSQEENSQEENSQEEDSQEEDSQEEDSQEENNTQEGKVNNIVNSPVKNNSLNIPRPSGFKIKK